MSVVKFELQLVEGRRNPSTGLFDGVEAGSLNEITLNQIRDLCQSSAHYKAHFSVFFEGGDVYKGAIVLHPGQTPDPLKWVKDSLEGFIKFHEQSVSNEANEALDFLSKNFNSSSTCLNRVN
jgi:hypothetical protein